MSPNTLSLSHLIELCSGRIANESEIGPERIQSLKLTRMSHLSEAKEGDVAFFFSPKFKDELLKCRASVIVTAEPFVGPLKQSGLPLWKTAVFIVSPEPYLAMARVSEGFAFNSSVSHIDVDKSAPKKIHPSAVVDPSAEIAEGVEIRAHVVIEKNVRIGRGSILYPGVFVGQGAQLGDECVLFPRVALYEKVRLGNRVRIHAGAVIGADGFGYAPTPDQGQVTGFQKITHFGAVVLGDDVEIGANTCIDRGTIKDTLIGPKTKIDDQVMIAHNCELGEGVLVCGGVSMAGSVKIGDFVTIGGMCAIPNGTKIGSRAKLAGGTFVFGDIQEGQTVAGYPHRNHREFFRLLSMWNRLLDEGRRKK